MFRFLLVFLFAFLMVMSNVSCHHEQPAVYVDHPPEVIVMPPPPLPQHNPPPAFAGTVDCSFLFRKDSTAYDSVLIRKYFRANPDSVCNFLSRHIRYPERELESGIQGSVYVEVCYNKTYTRVDSLHIARRLPNGPGCDDEVLQKLNVNRPMLDSLFRKKPPGLKHTVVRVRFTTH